MKIERIKGDQERRILTAMIVDGIALGRIAAKWEKTMFRSRWADIVGQWCVTFYESYGKAPNQTIQSLFESWASTAADPDTVGLVEKFLTGLSDDYEGLAKEINTEHVVDMAGIFFTRMKIDRLITAIQGDMEVGKVDEARKRVEQFGAVALGNGDAIDVLNDQAAIQAAFEDQEEDLINYNGALGVFFRGQLTRDGFIAFLGAEKKGKTFWLMDMAWRAMLQRRKVAFFSAGDMSERQMMRRLSIRASRKPIRAKHWPCEIRVPSKIRRKDGVIEILHETKVFLKPLNWREAWEAMQEVVQYKIKDKTPYLRLATYPNSVLSVKGIETQLRTWEREGWTADVVIIDYADILDENAAMPGQSDARHKVNATWKQLRALSQKFHCLVITATQADAASYDKDTLNRTNFSEDKRKMAHVTGMIGINQTKTEKEIGAYRLNWIVLREGEFTEGATVAVAACVPLAAVALKSCF